MATKNEGLENLFDVIGEILAFLTIALYAALIIDANWEFIPKDGKLYEILLICRMYASLALIIVVGLEATVKRSLIIRLIFYVLAAVVIIFSFFPDTWDSITTSIGAFIC